MGKSSGFCHQNTAGCDWLTARRILDREALKQKKSCNCLQLQLSRQRKIKSNIPTSCSPRHRLADFSKLSFQSLLSLHLLKHLHFVLPPASKHLSTSTRFSILNVQLSPGLSHYIRTGDFTLSLDLGERSTSPV